VGSTPSIGTTSPDPLRMMMMMIAAVVLLMMMM
jgi:hypothetical protein